MEINTKFEIGDKVELIRTQRVYNEYEIVGVSYNTIKHLRGVRYTIQSTGDSGTMGLVPESNLRKVKEKVIPCLDENTDMSSAYDRWILTNELYCLSKEKLEQQLIAIYNEGILAERNDTGDLITLDSDDE